MINVDKQTSGAASHKKHGGKLTGKPLVYKALAIATGLSNSQRRVAIAIVDHMNSRTGRCDPGMRRLAFDTGHQLSTVQQAVSALTDPNNPDRFFDNINPGRGKTPCYKIRWDEVETIVDQFEVRTRLPTVQELPNSSSEGTVLGPPNSGCSEGDPPTVRHLQNKTNLRTIGARPAAHQAARPARAPSQGADENFVEAVQVKRSTPLDASLDENPVPGCSFEQKTEGLEQASPGSPSRVDGGSPAPPSEAVRQSSTQSSTSRQHEESAPLVTLAGRKPVLPPINDQALYNRLTKRSRR
ncbi:hypothetical protein EOA33_14905 [Mesorhizobium sp. M4A.F.Ca.ET.050.02.1.1]|uniref:hypothetical protein n=1 Tax=Mesorhizobium sp. M4A.F.Ca.ET.050.02.1.1 TaxID=2496754 RepID=UPI000FCA1DD2|nr:hypothetical protein [Mesorhizobium sp. M4A.F.Ca.ET.050.02.1.1]RUX48652.1 hypothetical protein EOA33_14905 [Mesorhizobium sp. M4A.F.Ca.ET.050.02.1.1]